MGGPGDRASKQHHSREPTQLERLTNAPVAGLRIRGAGLRCSGSHVLQHAGAIAPWPACVSLAGSVRFVRRS